MAPGLRTNVATRTTRGANRAVEHDDFEGLPVRQWRLERANIAPPEPQEQTQQNDKWAVELPHGMPKDSHLLPQHSQDLLRALRSGRFYKRSAPPEEEETDPDHAPADKPEKKEEDSGTKGFTAAVWKAIPRNAEGPELSHLAKRRKGTVVLQPRTALLQSGLPTVTRAKVRRIDAAGNPYIQDVILADGEQVEGEVISTSVVAAPVATAALDGSGSTQITPMKRKPIIPKKKNKGPGRGRKKKLPLPTSMRPDGSAGDGVEGGVAVLNGTEQAAYTPSNQDSPMVDDDEGDDDDGDEGDEDTPDTGRDESQDHEMRDALPEPPALAASTDGLTGSDSTPSQPPSVSALAPPSILPLVKVEGSPLKNVITPSPTAAPDPEPIPTETPITSSAEPSIESVEPAVSLAPVSAPEPVPELSPDIIKEPADVVKQESPEVTPPMEPLALAPEPEPIPAATEEPSPPEPTSAPESTSVPEPEPEPEPESETVATIMDLDFPAVPGPETTLEGDQPASPKEDGDPATSVSVEVDFLPPATPAALGEDDGDDLLGKLMGSLD